MILYLDSSALVRKYVAEPGSRAVVQAIAGAQVAGTVVMARAKVAAAFAKAVRVGTLAQAEAESCLDRLRQKWPALARIRVTEATAARADQFAWRYHLRGYDAVHLAAATLGHGAGSRPERTPHPRGYGVRLPDASRSRSSVTPCSMPGRSGWSACISVNSSRRSITSCRE